MENYNNNEKRNLYERIDDSIMKGVNASVRTWNWTTERTKADLAGIVMHSGAILGSAQAIMDPSCPAVIKAITAAWIPLASLQHWVNRRYEQKEEKAADKDVIDYHVEEFKEGCKKGGAYFCSECSYSLQL